MNNIIEIFLAFLNAPDAQKNKICLVHFGNGYAPLCSAASNKLDTCAYCPLGMSSIPFSRRMYE